MSDLKTNLQEILQEKQEKIIPENIKKDVQIFDVVGTYEGSGSSTTGVKLFETEEEMQADSTAQEGDLAVVYREEIQNMTVDTETQYITFPETVTLPEAFTGDVHCILRAVDETVMFDGQVMLNQSMFNFSGYIDGGMITVRYTSSDGITYNRDEFMTDSGELTNPVDLGAVVKVYMPEEWNDILGYFMQAGGNVFDGLYEYGKYAVDGYISIPLINDDYTITSTPSKNVTINNSYNNSFNKQDLINICKEIEASVSSNTSNSVSLFMKDNKLYALGYVRTYNKKIHLSALYNEIGEDNTILSNVLVDGGGTSSGTEGEPNFEVKIWEIDMNNKSYSLNTSIQYEISYIKSITSAGITVYSTRVTFAEPFDTMCVNQLYTDMTFPYMWKQVSEDDFDQYGITCGLTYNKSEYQTAPNQYTLSSSNQLLPNISAYGKNGNVIGDESVYDNLDYSLLLSAVGIDSNQLEPIGSIPMNESKGLSVYIESNKNDFDSIQHNILNEADISVVNKIIAKSLGDEDTQFVDNQSCIELDNGNKLICILHKVDNSASPRRCTLFVLNNDFSNIINSVELATNDNRLKTLEYVFTDRYIYIIIGGYYSSTYYWYVSKVSREDGSVIKSVSTTTKMLADKPTVYATWYNDGVLIYGADNDRCKNCGILHFTSDLEIDLNTNVSITGGDDGSHVGVSDGVIVNNNFYCVLCGRSLPDLTFHYKLIKISGTTVTSKDVSSYISTRALSCDEKFIYTLNNDYCTKFDTDMNVISTNEAKSAMYHNLNYVTLSFVDYLNYTVLDFNTNEIYVVTNGNYKSYEPSIVTYGFYNNCYNTNVDDLVWRSTHGYLGKYLLLKGIIYTNKVRFSMNSNGNIILITTVFDYLCSVYRRINSINTISPEEYNTALDTSEQILGEEETVNE